MSNWAADGLRAAGVSDERIMVLHPGLDLQRWRSVPSPAAGDRPLRLLFVGGDFERKGGDLVLAAASGPFAGRVLVDVVTREAVPETPGVTVHRCEPNSPELMERYAAADVFVMPTRADCYGHAVVEAMASGRPAIVGDVGGVAEIVEHRATGWCVTPDRAGFEAALSDALARRAELSTMGERARRSAEVRFDGHRNDRRLVDAMLALASRRRRGSAGGGAARHE
jgi:glycosyltransferase involved in cell wall biosynthesis